MTGVRFGLFQIEIQFRLTNRIWYMCVQIFCFSGEGFDLGRESMVITERYGVVREGGLC